LTALSRTHLLFLGIRVLGVFSFLACAVNLVFSLTTLASGRGQSHPLGLMFAEVIVPGALSLWLFIYPDKLATRMFRRSGPSLAACAHCLAGLMLSVASAIELPSSVRIGISFRGLHSGTPEPIFAHGMIPNDQVVARYTLMLLGGLALIVFAKPLADWTDPDWRKAWIERKRVEAAIRDQEELG
jgi:hypothetical protein